MKPLFHKVPIRQQQSFSIRKDISNNFGNVWHYHPELELHYVKKGAGVRFIGNDVSNFSEGEMILLGANLPHTWRCNVEYYQGNPDLKVEASIVHFLPECLGHDFLNLPEAHQIPKLFALAQHGLIIKGQTKERLLTLISEALEASDLRKLTTLLAILSTLSESDEYEVINTSYKPLNTSKVDAERINKICDYTLSNFRKEITLNEIASISNLSATSFCRYFKLMTKKTYYDFLIEIRISHACRMLIETNQTVEAVCLDCGFNNASNFYRHFKKITGFTPADYKRKYLNLEMPERTLQLIA
jgi:AraC-like DNA-binding protein